MNIQLIEIKSTKDSSGALLSKLFTFQFPGGTVASVGLQGADLLKTESEQKQTAARKAQKDVESFARSETVETPNETINL